jgi:hypothetical protein
MDMLFNTFKWGKLIKLGVGICLLFVLLSSVCFAYQIKYYGKEKIDVSFLNNIPNKYYTNLNYILIYDTCNQYYGGYYYNKILTIYNCPDRLFEDVLIHELAHHQQYLNKEKITHNTNFIKYETRIWDETI